MIIVGKDCENCIHATFDETNKAKIMVYCNIRERWYIYGMCIDCNNKTIIKEGKKDGKSSD